MSAALESSSPEPNVTQAVPFFGVTDMRASLRFYVDGLGFRLKHKWTPEAPDHVRWCWLEIGSAALMLHARCGEKRQHVPHGAYAPTTLVSLRVARRGGDRRAALAG